MQAAAQNSQTHLHMKKHILYSLTFLLCTPTVFASTLYIGDSHSASYLGEFLQQDLTENLQQKVNRYAVGGSSMEHWLQGSPELGYGMTYQKEGDKEATTIKGTRYGGKGFDVPLFSELLKKHKPDLVIIALGSNAYWKSKDFNQQTTLSALTLLKNIRPTAKCVWIAPPPMPIYIRFEDKQFRTSILQKPTSELTEFSKQTVAPVYEAIEPVLKNSQCKIIRSIDAPVFQNITTEMFDSEGVHINYDQNKGAKTGKAWESFVFEKIQKIMTDAKNALADDAAMPE